MRLQRVFFRLQEGASYSEVAAEEGVSAERIRQIVRRARALKRDCDRPDHARMQIARLTPAVRLAAAGVAGGDTKAIPLLLSLVDRLDRYWDPDTAFRSPALDEFSGSRPRRRARRAAAPRPAQGLPPRGETAEAAPQSAAGKAGDDRCATNPDAPRVNLAPTIVETR